MTRLTYRPATADDLPFIVNQIVEDSVVEPDDDPQAIELYLPALAAIDADPNQELLIAEYEGKAVGSMQLSYLPGIARRGQWRGLIEAVHIRPESRNLGLGSEMIGHAIAKCKARGCGVVQLTSNKNRIDAHRFYRKLGFAQSHEGSKLTL
ncbi:GNAT family N-acetyltransferase [Devosia sp.]|uniref:GNAT family N-acetyltransferase n=1 Tax=Devosia sp. TaxID=1871048 RepID=UPI003A904058